MYKSLSCSYSFIVFIFLNLVKLNMFSWCEWGNSLSNFSWAILSKRERCNDEVTLCEAVCCRSRLFCLTNGTFILNFPFFQYSLVLWLVCEDGSFKYRTGYSYISDEAWHYQKRITPHSESPCLFTYASGSPL